MTHSLSRTLVRSFWIASLFLPASGALLAQNTPRWRPQAGVGEVTFLSANTVIGALTGGILQKLRGGSFADGFARGALGGAIVYGGKRLSVERFAGAGFIGREISAVGTSVVRNASEGVPSFQRLVLPVGPARLYVHPATREIANVKLDLYDLTWLVYGLAEPALSLDFGKTLSAGAPVFLARNRQILSEGDEVRGVTGGGTVLLAGRGGGDEKATFAHERVHVIQRDFYGEAWFVPLESWILEKTPLRGLNQYVDFNVATPLYLSAWAVLVPRESRPEEIEAEFLEIR